MSGEVSWVEVNEISIAGLTLSDVEVMVDATNSLVWVRDPEEEGVETAYQLRELVMMSVEAGMSGKVVMPGTRRSASEEKLDDVWDKICERLGDLPEEQMKEIQFTFTDVAQWMKVLPGDRRIAALKPALEVLADDGKLVRTPGKSPKGVPYKNMRYVAVYDEVQAYLEFEPEDDDE